MVKEEADLKKKKLCTLLVFVDCTVENCTEVLKVELL